MFSCIVSGRVDTLTQNNHGEIVVEYDENYLGNPAARSLS